MSLESEIANIRDWVKAMNDRGIENAKIQGTIAEKVSNIEISISEIKKLAHIPAKCDLENDVVILKEQVKEIPKGMSKKKEVGIIGAVSSGIIAVIEAVKWLFIKP